MGQIGWAGFAGFILAAGAPAMAADTPLYQPAPPWVTIAPLPDAADAATDPPIVIFDMQQRIEGGRLWSYVDSATRIASPEMLAQLATITIPWLPDQGDLIVHELTIIRDTKPIDLIAQGQKFTVLRREQSLEQRELTGILSATLAIEGLQVGDILRLRVSTTTKDMALAGRVQSAVPVIAEPTRVGFARFRFSWPTSSPPLWKLRAEGLSAKPVSRGAYTELSLTLPAAKQPEMPADAPMRYNFPPMIELSTFSSWGDVSSVMAPLYATRTAIAPDSPIGNEIAAIMAAEASPLGRAERALEIVQDKIRYLAIGMNGGNYTPQQPERTWTLRYGDCKAKTLLLLAMLHAMHIEAEPVLASIGLADIVPARLPSAAAFNHVVVRATIDGESLWLDGTGSGSRLADIHDTPPFRHVLPVRVGGADLMTVAMHANARPMIDLQIDADESASLDLPSAFEATAVVRGGYAPMMTLAKAQMGEKEQRQAVGGFFQGFLGELQISQATITPDPAAGIVTLSARGVITTPWFADERKQKRKLTRALDSLDFAPDRGRPTWTAIPVAATDPAGMRYRLRVRLPDGGKGYTIEGEPKLNATLAGYEVTRDLSLANGIVTVDERIDTNGEEIPASRIPVERDNVATAKARAPRIVAPDDASRRWMLGGADPAGATQVKTIEATLAKAIANDPDEASAYATRSAFRNGIGDRRGALADLTRANAIAPTVDLYLQRASVLYELGDLAGAANDVDAARKLDPSSAAAIVRFARLKAERGDLTGAAALLDERIALGGDTKAGYSEAKAALIGEFGDPAEAIKLYDALITDKPGSPSLMNARCWVKGTRSVMLDTALKDCTDAIELSSNTAAPLDSRALVWYRLGRFDDALRDLDAVLASIPSMPASRFMRGAVLQKMHRDNDAEKEFAFARLLSPSVDRTYARYGIKSAP